jgi:hypothetical protein
MHRRTLTGIGPAAGAPERLMSRAGCRFGVEILIGMRALA